MTSQKAKIEQVLNRGVERIYPSKKALNKLLLSKNKIKVYQGFDPSMPNLHLGNLVGILKLRQFQKLGHSVIFLVGDFTGMIGDPTDKSAVRPKLTRKQVLENAKNWKSQASRFLSFSEKNPARFEFNSKWQDNISFKELIEITSRFTVQQMLQRDFFQKRIKNKKPIFLHEFLYPVAQAIDCVEMDVDIEVGGNDQTFNMLAGRALMKALKGKEKFVLTTKLLVDKEGKKAGKTSRNAIFLNTPPNDMFGKVMAFPDELIAPGFELLTLIPVEKIKLFEKMLKEKSVNPMELKKKLASEIVGLIYDKKAAQKAGNEFERVFSKRKMPKQILEIKIKRKTINILELLIRTGLCPSKSQGRRLITEGAVCLDGKRQKDWQKEIKIKSGMVVRVGKKRFIKIA